MYFSDAVFFKQYEICNKILDTNFNDLRATVTTSISPTKSKSLTSPFIGDVSYIRLNRDARIIVGHKTYSDVKMWNPMLLLVSQNNISVLEKLVRSRGRGHIHFKNTFSRPYDKDKEK